MSESHLKTALFVGPNAPAAARAFQSLAAMMGVAWTAVARESLVDAPACDRLIVLGGGDVPTNETTECWKVDAAHVQAEVMKLVARLKGPTPETVKTPAPAKRNRTAKVGRETAGRRGKGVTTVFDHNLDEAELRDLAATLKQRCGTGGTVKDNRIEIQGDQRDRIIEILEELGFRAKRAGG